MTVACLLAAWSVVATTRLYAQRFFPLDEGSRWIYAESRLDRELEASVPRVFGDVAIYDIGGVEYVLRETAGDEIDIEIEKKGFLPFYRFSESDWRREDTNSCDQRPVVVANRNTVISTAAGDFTGCIEVDYMRPVCSDAGRMREWWAPDVGLVKWEELSIIGLITWELQSFHSGGSEADFRRGDSDGNGTLNLTDAVVILNWLFLSGDALRCADAADVDDSGKISFSDAIALLNFVFLGDRAPNSPGPDDCGPDPVDDTMPVCIYTSC